MENYLDRRSAEYGDKFEEYRFDVEGDQWNKEVRGEEGLSASNEYQYNEQVQSTSVSVSNDNAMKASSMEFRNGHASPTLDKNENGSATSLDQEESDFVSSKTRREELQQLCDVLMEERDMATASLRERSDEVLRLRKRALESEHEKSDLKIQLAEAQGYSEQLEEDLTSVKEENERLKAEIERLRNRIDLLETESANLKIRLQARENRSDIADGKITRKDSESAELVLQVVNESVCVVSEKEEDKPEQQDFEHPVVANNRKTGFEAQRTEEEESLSAALEETPPANENEVALDESVCPASEEEEVKKKRELKQPVIASERTTELQVERTAEEVSLFVALEETPPATENEVALDESVCPVSEEEEVKKKRELEQSDIASEGTTKLEAEGTTEKVTLFAAPEGTPPATESEVALDELACVANEKEEEFKKQKEFEHPVIVTEGTIVLEAEQTKQQTSSIDPPKETPGATDSEVVVKRRETWRTAPNHYRHSFAGSLPRPFHTLELHSQHSLDHPSKHERSESVHSDTSGESESDVHAPPSIPSFMRRKVEKPFLKSAGFSPVQFNYQPLPDRISNRRRSWLEEARVRSDSLPTAHENSSNGESSVVITKASVSVAESTREWVQQEQVANTMKSAPEKINGVNGSDNPSEFVRSLDFDVQLPQYTENARDSSIDLAPNAEHENGTEVV